MSSDGINEVLIVETGTANTTSVLAALRRLGADARIAENPEEVRDCARVVLPGVGSFADGMRRLEDAQLVEVLRARVQEGRPLLAISLGFQLLLEGSAEAPGIEGIGAIPGQAIRLDSREHDVPLPQICWNRISTDGACHHLDEGWVYFANSFALAEAPEGWSAATADYGGRFTAAIERGEILGCQFHPELSGGYGRRLLRTWLEGGGQEQEGSFSGPTMRVVPCLDIEDGRVVRRVHFDSLNDAGDPLELASAYELQGADEIVVTDVSASRDGQAHTIHVIEALRERLAIPLTAMGGVSGVGDARRLFAAGADKVAIGSAVVRQPGLLSELAATFGRQCIVLSIDAARSGETWHVLTRGGREDSGIDVAEWAERGAELGAGEVLLSSRDREGTKTGYDLDLIRSVRARCPLPLVANGGAASPEHMLEAIEAGASSVLAASIFHDSEHSVASIKGWLRRQRVRVRP